MPANITQIVDLINKLWARTQAGSLTWEQFGSAGNSFQCRLGDFVVSIGASGGLPFATGIGSGIPTLILNVKRLDGRPVLTANTGTTRNTLVPFSDALGIPYEAQQTLANLYRHLSTRDTDLDELLKQL